MFAGKHGGRTAKNGKARQAAGRARQSAVLKIDGGVTLNAAVKKTAELRRRAKMDGGVTPPCKNNGTAESLHPNLLRTVK